MQLIRHSFSITSSWKTYQLNRYGKISGTTFLRQYTTWSCQLQRHWRWWEQQLSEYFISVYTLSLFSWIVLFFSFFFIITFNIIADLMFLVWSNVGWPLIPPNILLRNLIWSRRRHVQEEDEDWHNSLSYDDFNISHEQHASFTLSLLDHNPVHDEVLEQQQTCVICLESMDDRSTIVATTCEEPHVFHRECIENFLSHEDSTDHCCPICGSDLHP